MVFPTLSVVDVNVDTCTGSVVDNMFVVDFVVVIVCVVVVEGSVVPDVVLTKLVVVDDPLIVGAVRVAELGSLSSGAKMAMKIFVKRVFTIFASNASFLRVIANLQN